MKIFDFFLYYLYTMQKNTKIALISGSIIAISLGAYLWYKSKKKQSGGADVVSDLQKIYNQLLERSEQGTGTQQGSGTQQSGQDESQRQSYKETSSSQQSSQQSANQKQLEQQKKQEEQFFKPKDETQPKNPFEYNDAQYKLSAYSTGTGDYGGYSSNREGSAYGYGSNWGTYGSGFWDRDRGYGGHISDY